MQLYLVLWPPHSLQAPRREAVSSFGAVAAGLQGRGGDPGGGGEPAPLQSQKAVQPSPSPCPLTVMGLVLPQPACCPCTPTLTDLPQHTLLPGQSCPTHPMRAEGQGKAPAAASPTAWEPGVPPHLPMDSTV